jgi:catechol 2,3-dioxygenase-like lactoylglutathione lyase family enzyme
LTQSINEGEHMIKSLSHACFYVLDQDRAKAFYTDKLGFEVRSDVTMGAELEGGGAGFRWLTVGPPDQPDVEIILADPSMGHDPATTEVIRSLVAKGHIGNGVMSTEDCQKTYEELSARGVRFIQEPAQRPYGVEAVFVDDSGNWFSLTQRSEWNGGPA